MAAPTDRAIGVNQHMSHLSAHAVKALKELPSGDDTAADASADRQIDKIIMAFTRTICPLGKACHIGIIIEIGRYTKMLADLGANRKIHPFGDIRGVENHPRVRVQWTRRSDSDGTYFFVRPNGFNGLYQAVEHPGFAGFGTRTFVG